MSPRSSAADRQFREITWEDPATSPAAAAPREVRLPSFIGLARPAGETLGRLKLAVVGNGSVGRRIALGAARLHPQALWLVDHARYKAESLLTQEILPRDVGAQKATNTGLASKQISPRTSVRVYDGPIQDLPMSALADAALVCMATDNLKTEVEVGQRCLHLGIPLVQASVHGDSLVAQVRFFGNRDGGGPCPACGFGAEELDHLHKETKFMCSGPDGRPEAHTVALPTMSTSFLCSLAADLALVQVTRHVLGLGRAVADTMLQYYGYQHRVVVSPLTANPRCGCEHVVWEQAAAPRPLGQHPFGALAAAAGLGPGAANAGLAFVVDDLVFVESACCCARRHPVGQFAPAGAKVGACPACGSRMPPDQFYTHRRPPAALVDLDRTPAGLGAPTARCILVECGDRRVLLH